MGYIFFPSEKKKKGSEINIRGAETPGGKKMAKERKVKATLRESLRALHALNRTYSTRIDVYSKWARENGLKTANLDQIRASIPDYIEHRKKQGLSAATLHTDLACLCRATGASMSEFETIRRGQPTKGRSDSSRRVRTAENQRVLDFATKVGIRKMEYSHLKGSDFVMKDGRAYVVVRKGKGGKRQEQLILPEDVELVKTYFDGSENYVFSKAEIKSCTHANLHEIRRERAQMLYERWRVELQNPAKREEMMRLLEDRFNENPKKMGRFSRSKMDTPYKTRGEVRKELYEANRPLEYDRLALLGVSVLALAHYREDVCVKHYMK